MFDLSGDRVSPYGDLAALLPMAKASHSHGCPAYRGSLQPSEFGTAADKTRHSADFIGILNTRQPQNSLINSTSSCKCSGGPS
jgi:hypothetical protein